MLTLTNSRLSVKSDNKKRSDDYENYIFRIYRENGIYWYQNLLFFNKKWIYYELLKIKDQKNPEMNTSEKIFKLTNQMISKSWNWYINRKLTTTGFKRPKLSNSSLYFKSNWSCKSTPKFGLKINSDWSNVKLRGQMILEFYEFTIHRKLIK